MTDLSPDSSSQPAEKQWITFATLGKDLAVEMQLMEMAVNRELEAVSACMLKI